MRTDKYFFPNLNLQLHQFIILTIISSKNIYIFSIQLLIVVNLSETLQNIVKAISLRINQLLTTFMFLFIIIYIV